MTRLKAIMFVCCIFFTGLACADQMIQQYESSADLEKLARDFIAANISLEPDETMEIAINRSDLPTQLSKCSTNIQVAFPREMSREKINALELTCNGEKSWQTFLPLDVQIYTKIVTAKSLILPDTNIHESDLDYSQMNINHLYNGYFKDKKEVLGFVASQTISAGTVITKKNTRRPQLVHRNQEVELVAKKNSIVVSMKGIAKSDGGLNDIIEAYNPSSKKTLQAVVVGSNRAEVVS